MVVAADAPTLVISGAVTWLILAGSVCTALVAVVGAWRKIVSPMLAVGATISEYFPIWVDIASKYHSPQGGETLTAELQALSSNQEVAAANQRAMMAQLETVIAQAKSLDEKLQDTRHKIIGEFAALSASAAGATTLVEAIVRTAEDLRAVRVELAALKPPEAP